MRALVDDVSGRYADIIHQRAQLESEVEALRAAAAQTSRQLYADTLRGVESHVRQLRGEMDILLSSMGH